MEQLHQIAQGAEDFDAQEQNDEQREKTEQPAKETYHEPLLRKHGPLRDISGQKSAEGKIGGEIAG